MIEKGYSDCFELKETEKKKELEAKSVENFIIKEFESELCLRKVELERINERIEECMKNIINIKSILTSIYIGSDFKLFPIKSHFGNDFDLKNVFNTPSYQNKIFKVENKANEQSLSDQIENTSRFFDVLKLVIGNVSQFIPSNQREKTDPNTHKWMIYIKNENADSNIDLSKYIQKVVYHLHESYSPSNVVTVTTSPFNLTRRGWGQFPVKMDIHLEDALNTCTQIVFNLKLDETFTGLQTLGNETMVDLHFYKSGDTRPTLDSYLEVNKGYSKNNFNGDISVKEYKSIDESSIISIIKEYYPLIPNKIERNRILIEESHQKYPYLHYYQYNLINTSIIHERAYLWQRAKFIFSDFKHLFPQYESFISTKIIYKSSISDYNQISKHTKSSMVHKSSKLTEKVEFSIVNKHSSWINKFGSALMNTIKCPNCGSNISEYFLENKNFVENFCSYCISFNSLKLNYFLNSSLYNIEDLTNNKRSVFVVTHNENSIINGQFKDFYNEKDYTEIRKFIDNLIFQIGLRIQFEHDDLSIYLSIIEAMKLFIIDLIHASICSHDYLSKNVCQNQSTTFSSSNILEIPPIIHALRVEKKFDFLLESHLLIHECNLNEMSN